MSKRVQPKWNAPPGSPNSKLRLYNSLTREKEIFVPQIGNKVSWYSCGPTVYDAAHLGHARSYISFDILRRVLSDYFSYDVSYVMNITDIDDKIIKRARQNYLFEKFKKNAENTEDIISEIKKAIVHYEKLLEKAEEKEKRDMLLGILKDTKTAVKNAENSANKETPEVLEPLYENAKDVLSEWLDATKGCEVNDNSVFSELPAKFEDEFFKDMEALNVLKPDVITRVSEYIDEIIQYIEKIIENGYGYESNGSVYFDTVMFNNSSEHFYAKLVPEAFGDLKKLQEGEGDLSISSDRLQEKKSPSDFALWKASKPGEPSWESRWGKGRPGWHIECSVMASDVLGDSIDIHTGGYDLKFPHHDNELAQAEAYFENDHWVRYFLHSGHLTIAGCKMSKSLKNFITIREALDYNTPRQIRLAFLLHSWKDTLDYSHQTLDNALHYERIVREFKLNVNDSIRDIPDRRSLKMDADDKDLREIFLKKKSNVHESLCDNIDTHGALESMHELIRHSNKYIQKKKQGRETCNKKLLKDILSYILKMLRIFGADFDSDKTQNAVAECENFENKLMPYIRALADFRENVRQKAVEAKASPVLKLCDILRDEILPNLGVRLEDQEGLKAAIKFEDPEVLAKERELKRLAEEKTKLKKEQQKEKLQKLNDDKERLKKMTPAEYFISLCRYSKFTEEGVPTHDKDGKELSESQMKKVKKLYETQKRKYENHHTSIAAS